MEFIEKLDEMRIARPMKPKWIRADSLWSRIAGNMFFSTKEKEKIKFLLEGEPGVNAGNCGKKSQDKRPIAMQTDANLN